MKKARHRLLVRGYDEIFNYISSKEIFEWILAEPVELDKRYVSPFRMDNNPGCWFTEPTPGYFIFHDFAEIPDKKHRNCIQAVQDKFGVDFYDALIVICEKFDLWFLLTPTSFSINDEGKTLIPKARVPSQSIKRVFTPKVIRYKPLPFDLTDKKFWTQFGISKNTLLEYEVSSAEVVMIDKKIFRHRNRFQPMYVYSDSGKPYKVYSPYSPKWLKWRAVRQILEGYSKLPDSGKLLFITKSLKDVMVLKEGNYTSFALPNESAKELILKKAEELKQRFEHIYVYTDNDEAGKNYSIWLTNNTGWNYINNPDRLPKDPSDLVRDHSLALLHKIINEKLNRDGVL